MDFEFTYDLTEKTHSLAVLAEHRALGVCLSHELNANENLAFELETLLITLQQEQHKRITLTDWVIEIEEETIAVKHNSLYTDQGELLEPDVDGFMDWELSATCGKDDVIDMLSSWLSFVIEEG